MQSMSNLLIYARLLMEIWSPDKPRTKKGKLFYKAKGVILHDQVMNQEWERLEKPPYQH